MKGLVTKIASLILGLGISLLALSCAPGPPNANQNQNGSNAAQDNANVAFIPPQRDPTCDVPNLDARRNAVEGKINTKIDEDNELKAMFRGHNGKPARLGFAVTKMTGSYRDFLEVHIKGVVTQNTQLDDLVEKLDNFMFEGCVHRIVFGPATTMVPSMNRTIDGFEWHYCDYPNVACPNGECRESCNSIGSNGNSNSNVNTNTSANSNPNSNANRSNMNTRP